MGEFPELFQVPPALIVTRPVNIFAPAAPDTVKFPLVPPPIVVVPVTVRANPPTEKVAPSAIVRLEFMVSAAAVVVVPAKIFRLLKEKGAAGRVTEAVNSTVPVPGVQPPGLSRVKP